MKFQVKAIDTLRLPRGKAEHIFWDDEVPGFGLRLREGGSRNWVFQYKLGEKHRRITLGSVKAIGLVAARDGYEKGGRQIPGARELYARVRLGQDPAGTKEESRQRAAETFAAIGKKFLADKKGDLRPGSYRHQW